MKNKLLKLMVIAGMLVFGAAQAALAGVIDSASYAVSCTIPAIPGVNAPPYLSQTNSSTAAANLQSTVTDAQNSQVKQEEKQTPPKMIQENSNSTTVETLYPR